MKKFKFILPLLAMFLVSMVGYGQNALKPNFAVTVISKEATQATVTVSYEVSAESVVSPLVQKTIDLSSLAIFPPRRTGVAWFLLPRDAVNVRVEVRTNTGEFDGLCLINPWPRTVTFDFTN